MLELRDGFTLFGQLASSLALDALFSMIRQEVIAEGMVFFHPTGKALRIEIDYMARATAHDEVWARAPQSGYGPIQITSSDGDVMSFAGQWPGDESDEVIFTALRELS